MERDKIRRKRYTEPIYADFSGVPENIARELKRFGFVQEERSELTIDVLYKIKCEKGVYSVQKQGEKPIRIKGLRNLVCFLRLGCLCHLMRKFEESFL